MQLYVPICSYKYLYAAICTYMHLYVPIMHLPKKNFKFKRENRGSSFTLGREGGGGPFWSRHQPNFYNPIFGNDLQISLQQQQRSKKLEWV